MLNVIWGGMVLLSVLIGGITGRLEETVQGAFQGAETAVTMLLSMTGAMCLWTGLIKIAEQGGILSLLKRCLRPFTKRLLPGIPEHSQAMDAVVANIAANILGLGNAATPLGISAIQKMKSYATGKGASDDMCMFIVLNTASIQLIPSTVIAMRAGLGSADPDCILPAVWIASLSALMVGVVAAWIGRWKTP